MNAPGRLVIDLAIILLLIVGVALFRSPRRARAGNLIAAFALLCAALMAFYHERLFAPAAVLIALSLGAGVGYWVAMKVDMVRIPSMVAFQNGAGGLAACLVAFVELSGEAAPLPAANIVGGVLAIAFGAVTFSGSMIATSKLSGILRQTPVKLPGHSILLSGLAVAAVVFGVMSGLSAPASTVFLLGLIAVTLGVGVVFSVRIGGADMPVLISFLNAGTGLAAAFCGVVIQNRFLIVCGALVGASGSILTLAMCRAMNRNLAKVLAGLDARLADVSESFFHTESVPPSEPDDDRSPLDRAAEAMKDAGSVIIVPGYGMALAQAHFDVVKLARDLEEAGKAVCFAIHPVAGRMPGHMNVLLAEADVDYEMLHQMDEINPRFKETDLAIVVGACDVVNPAAINVEGTPISGMPILHVHEASRVVVCNLDDKPGYSGVDNPLYQNPRAILLFDEARASIGRLSEALAAAQNDTTGGV